MTPDNSLIQQTYADYRSHFGGEPEVAAFAPGRIEVLGNHTDYNEGYVLSAAIDLGTCFLAARSPGSRCALYAPDVGEEDVFDAGSFSPSDTHRWANYIKGVIAGLRSHSAIGGLVGCFRSNLPIASGLSSSAALEISSALAIAHLFNAEIPPLELARIGQSAEHHFAGVRCGLLDQVTSLFGKQDELVMMDFRTLAIQTVPLGRDACFVVCNTGVKHTLVDSAYNERRAKCEEAATFFNSVLPRPIGALRDVTWAEWEQHSKAMDPDAARRSAHVIGENERVLKGMDLLRHGQLPEFGQLMFSSHASSREYFENSCAELDYIVEQASSLNGVLGARLSGGGFGGSALLLVHERSAADVSWKIADLYADRFGKHCEVRRVSASAGAHML